MKFRSCVVRVLLAVLVGGSSSLALAQTCAVPGRDGSANSSGTVNTYYPPAVNDTYNNASNSIALGASRGAATAVAPGDLVMVVQMQCATLNATNTSNYGAGNGTGRGYTDPAGSCLAGRYEYVRAGAGTTAASLDLRDSRLSATYVQDATSATNRRSFQVVRVPQHAALTLSATVNAPYWDGSTGGVVALDVAGTLNWNGQTIDVSGHGFRGAAAVQWTGGVDADATPDYVATLASDQHATKGEGIAGTPRWVFNPANSQRQDNGIGWGGYTGGDQGRGAPGNAGGGGDNRDGFRDNGGGGGGGNGGTGGLGAYGWKSGGWGGTFTASDVDLRGIGGAAFASAAPNRVVMGGGGGAGGTNDSGADPINSSGGAGGGIVIVRAGSMSGSGTVNANGANGRTQTTKDGAGGGGAGGSVVLMSVAGGLGAVTVNVRGGTGGDSYLLAPADSAHAGGGGGAGGVVIRSGAATVSNTGSANGITNTADNPVGGAAHGATGGTGGSNTAPADSSFTNTSPSAQCLPQLSVVKTTLTPTITTASATSVSYTIVVSNSGGAAIGADLVDNALPPGWTFSQTSGLTFAPALSGSAWGGFVESSTPGQPAVVGSPGTSANLATNGSPAAAPVWANLTIPGVTNGTPGQLTLSFVVSLPASAPVGCFHNPAGVKYLDPTRSTADREITPAANNTSNRAGALVGGTANTAYETDPGTGTGVGGTNYSGLVAGPTREDVCLLGDLSITKSGPASVTAGQTLTYTLSPRNNGRTIRDLVYATDQASDASNANVGTRVLSNGSVRVTDILPAGLVITSAIVPTGWTCGLSGQTVTCDSTIALPIAASTNLNAITGTVRVSNSACPGPLVNTAAVAGFQAPYADSTPANGTATVSSSLVCSGTLTVAKTNGVSTVTTGDTTTYTVTLANEGPASADGTVARDLPDAGLDSCSVVSCSASGGSPVATCPATPANLLATGGVALPSLPAGGTVTFGVRCSVTASGT